jgi:hypothetical protein
VQRRAVGFVEPVAGIERKEIDFSSIWEVCGLVHEEAAGVYACLESHI